MTYQFGCACYAGLILSLIQLLKDLVEKLNPDNKKDNNESIDSFLSDISYLLRKGLYYIVYFLVSLIEKLFQNLSKHALIYCSIYGVSFSDACYRWGRKDFSTKITKFRHNLMISSSLLINYVIFSILAIIISVSFCKANINDFSFDNITVYLTTVSTIVLMASFFYILNSLITTAIDTIYLCFLEQPKLLSHRFRSLSKSLEHFD